MRTDVFRELEALVLADAEGSRMAAWALALTPCAGWEAFRDEYSWVVLCSGISFRAARSMEATWCQLMACAHPMKRRALITAWDCAREWWAAYSAAPDDAGRLAYLRTLPMMGGRALVYQLCKNLGITKYCKPDVHLVRLAEIHGYPGDPQGMCEALAAATGRTVAYIDTVVWYAAMRGWAYGRGR